MGAKFVASSAQYIRCATPDLTTRPITIGCWYKAAGDGTEQCLTSIHDTQATERGWELFAHTGNITTRMTWWTGSATQATAIVTSTRDEWNYVICRLIARTSKRMTNLSMSGGITHANNTGATDPVALNTVDVGGWSGSVTLNGALAEWWMADIDIQADGLELNESLFLQLAYKGPFSVPHIVPAIVEYRSFWQGIDSNEDRPGHVYQRGGRRMFTAINGPTIGEHPPISGNYVRPGQSYTRMVLT